MTARVKDFSPQTKVRSANCLMTTALAKVPDMFRLGVPFEDIEGHILVAALLADELYEEAQV